MHHRNWSLTKFPNRLSTYPSIYLHIWQATKLSNFVVCCCSSMPSISSSMSQLVPFLDSQLSTSSWNQESHQFISGLIQFHNPWWLMQRQRLTALLLWVYLEKVADRPGGFHLSSSARRIPEGQTASWPISASSMPLSCTNQPYPLPKIHDILCRLGHLLENYDWPCHGVLCAAPWFCQPGCLPAWLVFPWGTYYYKRLPMGFVGVSDEFQQIIDYLVGHMHWVCLGIHDGWCFEWYDLLTWCWHNLPRSHETTWPPLHHPWQCRFLCQYHQMHLLHWFSRLPGFPHHMSWHCSPSKENSGHPQDSATWPINVREVHHFLGLLQIYKNMHCKHSEILAPLTALTSLPYAYR